jgi:succinate dehydrogenase / fumarate reductase iron-sulfur subunit
MEYDTFILKIYRGHPGNQYWEEFELKLRPSVNVISALMEIQKNPVNREGKRVEPVVWEQGCLEEVCGSCSMLVNGKPRQSCTALVNSIIRETGSNIITLAPFTKFPLVRDLIVDRTVMFDNLKKVHAWVDADGAYDRGPGPRVSQEVQEVRYSLSTCMTCGCCVEACPQSNEKSKFIGPQIFAAVRFHNTDPIGSLKKRVRIQAVMQEGGISDCGNAQNCVRVCPKGIPLTDAIAVVGRDATIQAFRNLFSLPDRE